MEKKVEVIKDENKDENKDQIKEENKEGIKDEKKDEINKVEEKVELEDKGIIKPDEMKQITEIDINIRKKLKRLM